MLLRLCKLKRGEGLNGTCPYLILLLAFICLPLATAEDLVPVTGIMHIQSKVSDGKYSIDEIAKKAIEKGIEVVFISDHDLNRWEYGFPPFRRLFKRKVELDSVLRFGADKYLALIEEAEKNNKGVIFIPGVEAAPFYYWKGNILKGNMELRAWHRHMLVVGLNRAEDYKNLPLVANRKSKFDQYHGDKWFKPHQDLIDYVNEKGGMTFWAHPEAENSQSIGGILIHTLPYPDFLLKTHNFTGFAILHEGYKEVGRPGGIWDEILKESARGDREKSVVAIGEIDYEGGEVADIEGVKNIFFVREKTKAAIMESLRKGSFYVVRKSPKCDLRLDRFEILSRESRAVMGESISIHERCLASANISDVSKSSGKRLLIKLIKNGKIIDLREETLPIQYEFTDVFIDKASKGYYRLDVSCEGSLLLSNPIFFRK